MIGIGASLSRAPVAPGMVLLATASASSVAAVDFTGLSSTYDEYVLHLLNVIPATNAVQLQLRTSVDGVTYEGGASTYAGYRFYVTAGAAGMTTTGTTEIRLAVNVGNVAANGGVSGSVNIIRPASTANNKKFIFRVGANDTTDVAHEPVMGSALRLSTAAIVAVRLMFSSGNIASGEFKLYGLRKSL